MNTIPHRFVSKSIRFTIPLVGLLAFGSGCSKSKISEPRVSNPQPIALRDFIRPNDQSVPSAHPQPNPPIASGTTDLAPPQRGSNTGGQDVAQSVDPVGDGIVLRRPSHPVINTSTPPANAQPTSTLHLSLLEAKVGDVNGKPIFTNSFFEPIEDRLIAEADRLPLDQWRQQAAGIINAHLNGIIGDELLRAEALTALTPTQRVGLQAFLNNFRNNLLSENLGSSQLARQRIEREQGTSLDEALRQKELDTLVQLTLIQEVNKRVNVSWRDIKQRYEQDIDEYAPPPTASFRVIRAFKDEPETVEKIQKELDAGTSFIKIAAGPLNNYNTDTDGLHRVQVEDSLETTKFFGPDALNTPAQSLTIGEFVGPIDLGSSVYWIMLADITQESISLYDAQLKIQREISFERRKQAKDEYLNHLMERARSSNREEVLMRLIEIAEERYGPKPN